MEQVSDKGSGRDCVCELAQRCSVTWAERERVSVGVDVSVSVAATRANTECDEGLMQRGNKLCFFHVHYVHLIGEYNNKDNKDYMTAECNILECFNSHRCGAGESQLY
jgi:hypothetical protein